MKRWLNILLQILGVGGQIGNLIAPLFPTPEGKAGVAAAIGVAQIVVSVIAHNTNPDGTPAEIAWTPEKPFIGPE